MSDSASKLLVRASVTEVFGAGRLDLIDELYAPAIAPQVKLVVETLRAAFPDLTLAIEHLVEEDDRLACRWTATGTQRGWFQGIPPTEARVAWTGAALYLVRHGRIHSAATSWDLFGLVQQLRAALA